jgi:hypothetical protein
MQNVIKIAYNRLTQHFESGGIETSCLSAFITFFNCNTESRRGPIEWPARSPDLTPLDFFLWGHLKSRVYEKRPRTIDELKDAIREECRRIDKDMLVAVTQGIKDRVEMCRNMDGMQFEHLLT